MKIVIVYYSSTGNTLKMAKILHEHLKENNIDSDLYEAGSFTPDKVDLYDRFLFGCPAMGSEELEEYTFLPMWESIINILGNKKISLFGSHDWGDGEWLETWEEDALDKGLNVIGESVAANLRPDLEVEDKLKNLANQLIK